MTIGSLKIKNYLLWLRATTFKDLLTFSLVGFIFFLPFDSFPVFPASSVYRPISVFFLIFPAIAIVLSGKIRKMDTLVILITFLTFGHALGMSFLLFDSYDQIAKTVVTLSIFLVCCLALSYIIRKEYESRGNDLLEMLAKVMAASVLFICSIGFLQIFSAFGLLPVEYVKKITLLFSYRATGRLQMVSGEPSMMVRHLLFFFPFIFFYYHGRFRKGVLFLIVFFLLFSGSTYGYLIIFLFLTVYLFLFRFSVKNLVKFSFLAVMVILFLSVAYSSFLDDYTKNKLSQVVRVLSDPDALRLVLKADGSIFQRVVNPTIGFLSGRESYFFGVGLDNYRYIYSDYIHQYFPYAVQYQSVLAAVEGETFITPKSLYAKIYSELGLVPFVLYVLFLIFLYFKVRRMKSHPMFGFLSVSYALIVVLVINMDSIIYVNYLFLIFVVTILSSHAYVAAAKHET